MEFREPPEFPGAGTYRGVEEWRAAMARQFEAWERILFEPEEFLERGDEVLATVRVRPFGRETQIDTDRVVFHVVTIREDRILRMHVFFERSSALNELGLEADESTYRAMADEEVEVVRGMFEAFLGNDFETSLGAFDPEVEWDGTNLPDGRLGRGLDAVVEHMTSWAEMWESWELELEDVIHAGGGRVIAYFREQGRSKAGLEVNERHSDLYVVRDGKIVYRKGFSDADEALVEAGLRRSGLGSGRPRREGDDARGSPPPSPGDRRSRGSAKQLPDPR